MKDALTDSIDFSHYFRTLANVLPDAQAIGVCDGRGVRVMSDHADAGETLDAAVRRLSQEDPTWYVSSETIDQREISRTTQAFLAGLSDSSGAPLGMLLVLMPAGDSGGDVTISLMEPIVQCVRRELSLASELDAMTAELTERYEELNLVYHTEDQVNYFREGHDALTQLVENCNNYLGVGLTALVLKSKKIEVVRNSDTAPMDDAHIILARLKEELYDWVVKYNDTVVINDVADARAASLTRGVPYKVLCTPVLDGSGTVTGVLVIVNEFSKPDFTNSDKNLLSVMARKAGKIIQTNYDALTGLVNRGGFEYFLDAAVSDVHGSSRQHCILHLNIDQLHVVNDTASHHAGDEVIRQVVATTAAHLRETDTLSRIGGDQFGILLKNCSTAHGRKIAEQIRRSVENHEIPFEKRTHKVTISIGVAPLNADANDLATVMAGAELACGESSEHGGNRIEVYHDENSELVLRRRQMQLVEKIQRAIGEDQFVLYCQPIEPIQDRNEQRHFEILLRMVDRDEIVPPASFIPAAERYHLMPAIDRWVVSRTFSMLACVPEETLAQYMFAINLSGQTLGDHEFLEFLNETLATSSVPHQSICFEITETAAIDNLTNAKHFMTTLGATGCQFSLDDFGVGLSSFSYLKMLPVDHLKIDGAFVKDILEDEASAAMVAAINQVGHTLGLKTIGEFVENEEICAKLRNMGVDYAQGFGICRPLPLSDQLVALQDVTAAAAS